MDGLKVELMAPAFDFASMQSAFDMGADAVYLGMKALSLRPRRTEPGDKDFLTCVETAHERKKRIYGVINVFIKDEDEVNLLNQLEAAQAAGVDGLIVADPSVIRLIKRDYPRIPVHVSVQTSITNVESARFYESLGAAVIIVSRSISFKEVEKIRKAVSCKMEVFIQGGLCYHFDGQCMLSSYWRQEEINDDILGKRLVGQNNTKGECHLVCKRVCELTSQEESLAQGKLLRRADLVGLELIPRYIELGIDIFKIEGRAMPREYIAKATKLYRLAINGYLSDPGQCDHGIDFRESVSELLQYRLDYEKVWSVK